MWKTTYISLSEYSQWICYKYECKFQYIAAAAVAENQHFMGKIIGNRINPTSLEKYYGLFFSV